MNIKNFTFNPFQENTYVLWDKTKECIIVDPGCYNQNERKELIPLFDENIPVNSYRDADFDFLGYKVYRGTEVLDTLGMDEHMYYDVVGVEGEVTYHVSAVYEEDGTGDIEEAPSQMVTVDLQNAAPTAVNLITPEDETVITLTADNVSSSDLGIFWSNSSDADGDQVEYTLSLCISEIDDCIDSTLIGTNVFIPYSDLYAIVQGAEGVTALTVTWNVETSDEWTSTASSNGQSGSNSPVASKVGHLTLSAYPLTVIFSAILSNSSSSSIPAIYINICLNRGDETENIVLLGLNVATPLANAAGLLS